MNSAATPSSAGPTQRLFFALWPPAELSRELYRMAGKVLHAGTGRRVAAENIHLTLAFLGSVDASFRECAERTASSIQMEPITLELEQMGCWPKSGILWTGPERAPEPLLQLVQALNTRLAGCGYQAETRPYAAHLTLARQAHPRHEAPSMERQRWETNQFHLVQSRTRADGAHYQILRTWPLSSPAA